MSLGSEEEKVEATGQRAKVSDARQCNHCAIRCKKGESRKIAY